MDWKQIPSLATLRAFEATARCGSFVGAARELNVTDAAIRQHVRALEKHFSAPLIKRDGRGITCTEIGEEFSAGLTNGFERIEAAVENAHRQQQRRPVRVALTPAFAENWLIPRLPQFWADHPDIQIDLAPSLKTVDLKMGNYDLAIRYGKGNWNEVEEQFLVSADYTIVASPQLERPALFSAVKDLRDAVWLFEDTRQEHRNWARDHGLDFEAEQNRFYPNNSLVLSAVRAGHGYSVQSHALVEADLSSGALVVVLRERSESLGYYLLSTPHLREDAQVFADWMHGLG